MARKRRKLTKSQRVMKTCSATITKGLTASKRRKCMSICMKGGTIKQLEKAGC